MSIVRVKSPECDRCDRREDLQVVSLHKSSGTTVSARGHLGNDLGHLTLCKSCRAELQGRGFDVTVMPEAIAQ